MNVLGYGLCAAKQYEDALPVRKAELSMMWRFDAPAASILAAQSNLANTYSMLGREEEALSLRRDAYSCRLKFEGEEHYDTISAANSYASSLLKLERFEEAKALMRKTMPVARRVLRDSNDTTLRMRRVYARTLYLDPGATLDDLREAVTTLEDTEPVSYTHLTLPTKA